MTDEHEHLDRERRHGWEQIKQLPGIEEPENVGQIINDGERHHGYGEYDIIIGGNPNEPGKVRLFLLGEFVLFAEEIVEDLRGVGDEFIIPDNKEHVEDRRQEHITSNEEIRHVVENADEVYTNGRGFYVWILYEGGAAKIVHGYDHSLVEQTEVDRIQWSTSYVIREEIEKTVENLINSNQLDRVYPEDGE